jgi:hypothetical protein
MKRQLAAGLLATVVTLLLAVGIAVAVEGGKSDVPPPKADAALNHDSDSSESSESESTESSSESSASDASAGEHPENHGLFVSEAAHNCPEGPEHGPCVAAVAKSDQGKKPKP